MTQNAMFFFKEMHGHKVARQVADMLLRGIKTPEEFDQLESHMDALQAIFPGAVGTYRRKNQYDLWVEAQALSRHALRSYPVATCSGTSASLKVLYGIPKAKTLTEAMLRKLLVHLYHQVQMTDAWSYKNDSLATMSLTTCGWHRSKQVVTHNGVRTSGLQRAVAIEEAEYKLTREELVSLDLPWDVQYILM